MEPTYTREKIGNSTTRMTLRNAGAPSGIFKLISPIMSKMMIRANRNDLQKIKNILESDNLPPSKLLENAMITG